MIAKFVGASILWLNGASTQASEVAKATTLPCSEKQAFGLLFGSTELKEVVEHRFGAPVLRATKEYAPFREIEVSVVPGSSRIAGATGIAIFTDRAAAEAFIKDMLGRFEASLPVSEKDVGPRGNRWTLYTGLAKQCSKTSDWCYHSDGAMIEFAHDEVDVKFHKVMLSCSDMRLEIEMLEKRDALR